MKTHFLSLVAADQYRRDNYGVLLTSELQVRFVGRGIHNPHHLHSLDVWSNKVRQDYSGQAEAYKDPMGHLTADRESFLFSPHANVISSRPGKPAEVAPEAFEIGDVVVLDVHGYPIGAFEVEARRGYNPHLVRVDIESSASVQHFIETGHYLRPGDAIES